MGTRALIHVKDSFEPHATLATIYRQYDGYPSGLGHEIKEMLGDCKLVNGFGMKSEIPLYFNGMGCLAAYLIGALKGDKIGNVYLYPADVDDVGEEYVYTLYAGEDRKTLCMRVTCKYSSKKFDGPLRDFDPEDFEV